MSERAVEYVPREAGFGVFVLTRRGWAREVVGGERKWWTYEDAVAAMRAAEAS